MHTLYNEDVLAQGDEIAHEEDVLGLDENVIVNMEDVAPDSEITFRQSRLVVTGVEKTPRVTSYTDLVDINLSFSSDSRDSQLDMSAIFISGNYSIDPHDNTEVSNKTYFTYKQDVGTNEAVEKVPNVEDESHAFDCLKFVLLLPSLSIQKNKGTVDNSKEVIKSDRKIEIEKHDDTCIEKLKFSDKARIQKNINSWLSKIRNAHLNSNPGNWGIELSDMAGDSSVTEEKYINFDKFKTIDVWQQISHYIKLKMRSGPICR